MRCSDAAPGRVRLLSRLPSDSRIGAFSVINVIQKLSTQKLGRHTARTGTISA
jgi:hypothetical protein